jgi:hypothetical protein
MRREEKPRERLEVFERKLYIQKLQRRYMEEHEIAKVEKDAIVREEQSEKIYITIRKSVIAAQKQVQMTVNSAMVIAYWQIGEQIYLACGENERARYGKQLLQYISQKMTEEFGRGFDERNLRRMRQFYLCFPIRDALRPELSWTQYRSLMQVTDESARNFYMEETVKSGWSSRQLNRQINTMYYQRILASKDKKAVEAEIETVEPRPEYEKIIKDPYVLEFLDLPPNEHYYETDLEQALVLFFYKYICGNSVAGILLSRGKNTSILTADIFISTLYSTTTSQSALSSSI